MFITYVCVTYLNLLLIKARNHGEEEARKTARTSGPCYGASGNRTHTLSRVEDFKSPASASSAIAPYRLIRRRSESNRRIEVLQTPALPLGYVAIKKERATGLEPVAFSLARRRSTN